MNVLAVGNNQFILNNLYSYTKGYKNINFFNVKSTSQLIIQFKEVDKILTEPNIIAAIIIFL